MFTLLVARHISVVGRERGRGDKGSLFSHGWYQCCWITLRLQSCWRKQSFQVLKGKTGFLWQCSFIVNFILSRLQQKKPLRGLKWEIVYWWYWPWSQKKHTCTYSLGPRQVASRPYPYRRLGKGPKRWLSCRTWCWLLGHGATSLL